MNRASKLPEQEAAKLLKQFAASEEKLAWSIDSITPISLMGEETRPPLPRPEMRLQQLLQPQPVTGDAALVLKRKTEPKGPMAVFGYDYFAEHAKAAGVATPKLLSYEGLWGEGEEYAYEVLNFADGNLNAQEIRDAVSAEYGPVPVELVGGTLGQMENMGIGERRR